MNIIILIEILVAIILIYAIQAWLKEAIQRRRELKAIKKDLDMLQSMKSEIEDKD